MRKYLRAIAHANMKRAGIYKPNKPRQDGRSYFAKRWKEWI